MGLRILAINLRLLARDGQVTEMTEYAPWPDRGGIWEAERFIDHDDATYEYIGCADDTYLYRETRRATVRNVG